MKSIQIYVQSALVTMTSHTVPIILSSRLYSKDPQHEETEEQLLDKYKRLIAQKAQAISQ